MALVLGALIQKQETHQNRLPPARPLRGRQRLARLPPARLLPGRLRPARPAPARQPAKHDKTARSAARPTARSPDRPNRFYSYRGVQRRTPLGVFNAEIRYGAWK